MDWRIFDEARFRKLIVGAEGFRVAGPVDLEVNWDSVKPRMRAYHGYPYTSIAVKLERA